MALRYIPDKFLSLKQNQYAAEYTLLTIWSCRISQYQIRGLQTTQQVTRRVADQVFKSSNNGSKVHGTEPATTGRLPVTHYSTVQDSSSGLYNCSTYCFRPLLIVFAKHYKQSTESDASLVFCSGT